MTKRLRAVAPVIAVRLAVAGAIIAGGALAMAGQASADPEVVYPTPVPSAPGDAAVPPGQPVVVPVDGLAGAPVPLPVGPPPVPEMQNPGYGQGQSSGPLGSLRDIWHQAQDPYGVSGAFGQAPVETAPPPGAGAPPQLPPGYISLNAPESNGPPPTNNYAGGPPLPAGYYPLSGPPPPNYDLPLLPIDPSAPVPPTP